MVEARQRTAPSMVLRGITQIRKVLGDLSEASVLKIKRQYPNMPMRKTVADGGIWMAHRKELEEFFALWVQDKADEYCPSTNSPNGDGKKGKAKQK